MASVTPQPERAGSPHSTCRVELYGLARVLSGLRQVDLELGERASLQSVLASLGQRCPVLVGTVIKPDCSGVVEGQALNLNGLTFVADPQTRVAPGDAVLLLSNTAGG